MSKVLYIKANIKPEGQSRTFRISDEFVESYKKQHPNDEVVVLDLYKEGIDFLRPEDLGVLFGPKTEESKKHPHLKYAYQFVEADKYIFAAPMWNLSIPAILKAYIDYISVTGITFKYTAEGPVGLCQNKKAIHIVTRGGEYKDMPYEMGDRYLRTILGFFGIEDIQTLAVDNTDSNPEVLEEILSQAIQQAQEIAVQF